MSFEAGSLAGLDEPVQRFFGHALRPGAALPPGLRLGMRGRIKADLWLPFSAESVLDGRSLRWRARVGIGPFTLLRVEDGYAHGVGSTEGRLFGRRRLFRSADEDTARSAAGRTALESVVLAPPTVLPERGVAWRAEDDETIVACLNLPPERPEVQVRIDARGAVRSAVASRWGPTGRDSFGYVPCGCRVEAEQGFGDLVIASRLTVSWGFGTAGEEPFLKAEITDARAIAREPG